MFHAINAWLARLARRICDSRLTRDNQIALANEWQIKRVSNLGIYRYRDPRFDLLTIGHADDSETVAVDLRTGNVVATRSPAASKAGRWA